MMINELQGVGPKKAAVLEKLSVKTVTDLLYLFPRTYEDRRECTDIINLEPGSPALVKGMVMMVQKGGYYRGRKQTLRVLIEDDSSRLEVVFFNAGYLTNLFKQGEILYFYGTPQLSKGKLQMAHPEFSKTMDDSGIIPIYPLTSGIGQKELRKFQIQASEYVSEVKDYIPKEIVSQNKLCSLEQALSWIHFPPSIDSLKAARYRLIFDELFILQAGLILMKKREDEGLVMDGEHEDYIKNMPFSLTGAQMKVVGEIARDMSSDRAMNRLVQGDVGSGKTAVAQVALYKAVKSGFQGAMMAPTDLLMKQHYKGLRKSFEPYGISVGYLSGNMTVKEKKEELKKIKSGETNIVVGTHALLQPGVEFENLGLVITDEQHRFGVNQRMKLTQKGNNPDIIVMTATPIPRTMAVVLYGDLDVSVIDELPPGRVEIKTKAISEKARNKAYKFLGEELEKGRQAYIVSPLISDSDTVAARSAEGLFEELKNRFPKKRIGLIHGEMKQEEKDEIMNAFYKGEIDVLSATVVIEVGIDVPNATVIIIENAERFGLAQLHQLRGRVGRSDKQSYCIIVCGENAGDIAKERATTLAESADGFFIAEKDLDLRGPGEVFGTRQHGIPDMHLADLIKHIKILELCKSKAEELLKKDPNLKNHRELRDRIIMAFGEDLKMIV